MARRSSRRRPLAAARRTRSDARGIQLIDRRRLLKIFQHVGILRDLAAIDAIGFLRHLLDRFFPLRRMRSLLSARPRECFQTGRDHQFQIPFGEHRVGIFPVEYFALLGDANLAGKTARRLGENGGMSRPAAAADRAAAAMEESQLHSAFLRGAMQLAMRLIEFPRAGEHAAVFVGVGVAEHDFLPASPGIEQRLISGIAPEAAHDAAGGAQRINGFEQRHGHQAGIVARSCDLNSALLSRGELQLSTSFSDSAPLMM